MKICIIGVQRSGTTLTGAIFKVRPDVTFFGDGFGVPAYLGKGPVDNIGVYKVTQITQQPRFFSPEDHKLFCVRSVKNTVSSMMELEWIKPGLAGNELKDCFEGCENHSLSKFIKSRLDDLSFDSPGDLHKIGAYVVGFKKYFFGCHENVMLLKYEELVSQPFSVIKQICDFCHIELMEIMFEHHKHLTGELHGTEFDRAIDTKSIDKCVLTPDQISDVESIEKQVLRFKA